MTPNTSRSVSPADSFISFEDEVSEKSYSSGRSTSKVKEEKNKECEVCGDVGLAKSYGAMCCGSCRTFFCRVSDFYDDLICNFNNECQIDKTTRTACDKCRVEKCFNLGMKKTAVHKNRKHAKSEPRISKKLKETIAKNKLIKEELSEGKCDLQVRFFI